LMVGQSIGLIHDILSCKDLLAKMHNEANAVLKKTKALFN